MLWSLPSSSSRPDDYVPLSTLSDEDKEGQGQGQVEEQAHLPSRYQRRRSRKRSALHFVKRHVVGLASAAFGLLLLIVLANTFSGSSKGTGSSSPGTSEPEPEPAAPSTDPDAPPAHWNVTKNPYFSTGDTWAHNVKTIERLERCRELGLLANTSAPSTRTAEDEAAAALQGCGWNETTVVVLASVWAHDAVEGNKNTGETVYAQSVVSSLNANGYAYLFASLGWFNHDMRRASEYYRKFPDNVRLVIADPEQIDVCWSKEMAEGQKCLKTDTNADGIPAWKLLALWWWDDSGNPLGPRFTLSPSAHNGNFFLSYSVEPTCKRLPYLAHADRASPPQVWLLAKQVHYLGPEPPGAFSWTLDALRDMASEYGVRFAGALRATIELDTPEVEAAIKAAGVVNFHRLEKIAYYEQLANSVLMLGVGRPRISPSPWDALCLGLPFINPILQWDEADPANRTAWKTQQWHMIDVEEPYVYHVHAHDIPGLKRAVKAALDNPIESYIPETMRFEWVTRRMAEVIDWDWRGEAVKVLDERVAAGNETFVL
ncbi:hypothetical protein Q8F55_001436 [Vanrija albida]|uniref:Glycosyltransferase family 18 catalytic domain-containing protein n=1 Tax=Vanrija albida TaxID=181172 RepID=A0ABR3QGH7_9TREE